VTRVHIICEGQTEEMFVKELLYDFFAPGGIYLTPSLIGKPGHKGGDFRFERLRIDVQNRLLGDETAYCTTFFDFYGLPTDFPGKEDALKLVSIEDKAKRMHDATIKELESSVNSNALRRFIPYIQMYEFEALLFSDPQGLAEGINAPHFAGYFQNIRDKFKSPEWINDSPDTAPSKRIKQVVRGYEKPLLGSLAALEIGLSKMRNECALFNLWLKRIESLVGIQ